MLKERIIGAESASIIGDPKTIRDYIQRVGEENFVVYGFPGFLVADSINKETSEKIAKAKLENVSYIPKPIGTIYCTDGVDGANTVTDDLDIAKLNLNVSAKDNEEFLSIAIDEITDRKTYFIGEGISGIRKGAFSALANYYNNLLSLEELRKYHTLFDNTNDEIRLTKKGESILNQFKETWDYTPREIRMFCKLDIRSLISRLFGDLNDNVPLDLEYIKGQIRRETAPDELKSYLQKGIDNLKNLIGQGKDKDRNYIHKTRGKLELEELEAQLLYEDIISRKVDIDAICDRISFLAPEAVRPKFKGAQSEDIISKRHIENYNRRKEWKDSFDGAITYLKTYAAQIRLHNIDPKRQLELLEKGGYVLLYEDALNPSSTKKRTMICKGPNFSSINDVGGSFCPMGLSDKWDTWKIERLGRDVTLTKYFRNFKGELLRISANNYGGINIEGSAEPIFDDATAKEINSIEEMINYALPKEIRKPFEFEQIGQDDKNRAPNHAAPRKKEEQKGPQAPKFKGMRKSDAWLLRKLRRH